MDDAAVAPEKLGAYLRDLRKLLDDTSTDRVLRDFRHGCIHMRVNFDLETEVASANTPILSTADLVVRYGGRSPGSMATARLAARCFRRCSAAS
jgi:hypothetical protein